MAQTGPNKIAQICSKLLEMSQSVSKCLTMGQQVSKGVMFLHIQVRKLSRLSPPPKTPQKNPRFTVFCALPFFSYFSELVAQDGSTWANIGLKMGQHSPQDGPT